MISVEAVNRKYSFLFDIPENFTPSVRTGEKFSITKVSDPEDAFMINPIKCGELKDVEKSRKLNDDIDQILLRTAVANKTFSKLNEDFTYGCLFLSNLINEMLSDLHEHDVEFDSISFYRVGSFYTLFRELENAAGYELRLYAKVKKESK